MPSDNFAYSYVETLYSRGIVSGQACAVSGGTCFRNYDFIIRGEMAKVVHHTV